jgi:hypothetical protein
MVVVMGIYMHLDSAISATNLGTRRHFPMIRSIADGQQPRKNSSRFARNPLVRFGIQREAVPHAP